MNKRKLALGDRNIIGSKITLLRNENKMTQKDLLAKLQVNGIDISLPALSLLEGQKRPVFDTEIYALANIFKVSSDFLLGLDKN